MGETYGRTLHKSKPASISGNNQGLVCTNETESMSVCIRIEGSDGKRWQGKTILCIPNKSSSCFRWQRLADLCIRFFQNKESGCKAPRIKAKTCIPKHREQGFWWQIQKRPRNSSSMVFNTLSVTRWNGVFWGPSPHRFLFGSEGEWG